MVLYKQSLVNTIDALIGENNTFSQDSWLDDSLVLSRMKILYRLRKKEAISFDVLNYLKRVSMNKKMYTLLISEILYLLNFKKKFSQKNIYRIVGNYFNIISLNMTKKKKFFVLPDQITGDEQYLSTIAVSNLYTINEFYDNEKQV
jgi:hypothetical protein